MLKWILGIAVGLVWCALIFVVTWWFTFPSEAVVDRIAFEVQKASDGKYALEATSASPWWTGLSLYGVTLSAVDDDGVGTPMLMADSVSARSNLFSLIGGGLPVHALIDLDGNPIVIDAELDRSEMPPSLTSLDAEARSLDIGVITKMLGPLGADVSGQGEIEILVDAKLGKEVDEHDGRMKVKGQDLTLDIKFPDPLSGGDFVIEDMKVSDLELVLDVKDGEAQLKRGRISSDRADIELDLDAGLNKDFNRTQLRGTMVLSNLGGELKTFEAAFRAAKWTDGKYHYRISCRVQRLSASCIKPERQPTGRRAAAIPDPEAIRDRIERSQDRPTATPEDRETRINPSRSRPDRSAANRGDRDEEEPLDDEEEPLDEDEEEPLDDEDDPVRREVEIDVGLAQPPPGFELPGATNPPMLPQ